MPERKWVVRKRLAAERPEGLTRLPPLLAQLLFAREISMADEVNEFLHPLGGKVYDPFLLPDMGKAVDRIASALRAGETVALYGDFDVDGITALALLSETLMALGSRVLFHIPDRNLEGYGLHLSGLRELRNRGAGLVITLDCGTTALAEIEQAVAIGLDIIVVDHHKVTTALPQALALVNPKRPDNHYPFSHLATVGLAYKLTQALLQEMPEVEKTLRAADSGRQGKGLEETLLDLLALGTVADVVPLRGENRTLLKRGLVVLNDTERVGLRCLISEAGLQPGTVDAEAIGYALGPRLNAAGRMAHAELSYRLLASKSEGEAVELAEQLGRLNRERQEVTEEMFQAARAQAAAYVDSPVLVVSDSSFAVGLAGLVASRLVEEFNKPAMVLEERGNECRGSARSVPGFDIVEALVSCQDLLIRYGGHPAAAGLALHKEELARFRERLREVASASLSSEDLVPSLRIDAQLVLGKVSWKTYEMIHSLEPFGEGNPEPLFLSKGVKVAEARIVGNDPSPGRTSHLRLRLYDGGRYWNAIGFGIGGRIASVPEYADIVYSLTTNMINDTKGLELRLEDFRPSEAPAR